MKRRILCLSLVFVSLISIVFSSFSVSADDFDINDYIEVHRPEIPKVDNNGDLLQDDIDTSFDDEFYNSPDEIDEDEKDEKTFDKKQYYSADDNTSSSNINSDVDSNKSSTVTKKSLSKSPRASSLNEENGISAQSDDGSPSPSYLPCWVDSNPGYPFKITKDNALICFENGFSFYYVKYIINDLSCGNTFGPLELEEKLPDLFTDKNLIIVRYLNKYLDSTNYDNPYSYMFIYSDNDFYMENHGSKMSESTKGNYFTAYVGTDVSNTKLGLSPSFFDFPDLGYHTSIVSQVGDRLLSNSSDVTVAYTGGHKFFIDGKEVPVVDSDDKYSDNDIIGEISSNNDKYSLDFSAHSNKEITDDTEYDVKLFAVDIDNLSSLTTVEFKKFKFRYELDKNVRYCDLSEFYNSNGIINKENQSISDTSDLEHIYYYIHQMKAYDDSEESVTGYNFDKFEIRNTCTFIVAYKLKGSEENYIICKDSIFVYNYEKTIDEVMGDYTVKKEYEEFPDIHDYIEDFPDVKDFLPEGEDPGPIDWVLAYIKWIGACLKTFGKNFLGFFKWLKDCVPIVWKNLGIVLYNMVCDLKSLLIYLFKPKTKSINSMVNKKIPGFSKLKNSFNNTNKAKLPYLKLFGVKFGFDFSKIDSDTKSFMRTISSVLIYIVFAVGVLKLIGKVFGFNIHGGSDDSDDSD